MKIILKKGLTLLILVIFILSASSSYAVLNTTITSTQLKSEIPKLEFTPPSLNKFNNIKISDIVKFDMPDILQTKQQSDLEKTASKRTGTLFVLINNDIFPDIKENIKTYTSDLAAEGYNTKVYTVKGKDPVQLRSFIQDCWIQVYSDFIKGKISESTFKYGTGVFIVGDLPVPLVHSRGGEYIDENGAKKPYEGTFVCDLYLTDIDGNWNYVDKDGIPFISTVDPGIISPDSECTPSDYASSKFTPMYKGGKGGAKPEIWMGRLAVSPLATLNGVYDRSKEVTLMKEYFERNHAYRHGYYPYVPNNENGLKYAARERVLYYDDPWSGIASKVIKSYYLSWPAPVVHDNQTASMPSNRYINTESITGHLDYLNYRLPQFKLWTELLVHSNPWYHEFVQWKYNNTKKEWEWQDEGWLSCDDIAKKTMNSLFYNIQGCDTCDYRQERFLGGTYLLKGKSLAVIGNTTVGPHDSGTLHKSLGLGASIGQAFMLNQQAFGTANWYTNMVSGFDNFDAKRYYGQTLLGDPTLKPKVFIPKSKPYEIGHGATDYAKLVPITINLPKVNVSSMVAETNKNKLIQTRSKIKIISTMPQRGYEYLKPDPNKIIRDPQLKTFVKLPTIIPTITPPPKTIIRR